VYGLAIVLNNVAFNTCSTFLSAGIPLVEWLDDAWHVPGLCFDVYQRINHPIPSCYQTGD